MNAETAPRNSHKVEPRVAWTFLTDGPLRGLAFAREAGAVLAWDEAGQLYLIDLRGEGRAKSRAPGKVVAAAVSDDGSRVALLGEGSRLWLLDGALGLVTERQGPPDATSLAIDPHGRYIAVCSRVGLTQFYNRHGKPAGRFETITPLAHLAFVADRPLLLAAASHGLMTAFDLTPAGAGRLEAEAVWQERQISNIGRLTASGDGAMVLASCFNHGVQRFDLNGHNDGSYHLGGTATHAVPDFGGRVIAVASLEGELAVLNSGGNVRWRSQLARPALALEVDPLGRYVIYGHETGEVIRLDLYAGDRPEESRAPDPRAGSGVTRSPSGGSPVRTPAWSAPVTGSDEQAETAVLCVLGEPPRVGVFTNTLRLQLFTGDGKNLGHAPGILGVGRIMRTAPGWVAAATDRQVVLFQASKNAAQRVDVSLVEVTHLAIRPESFGLAVVQERDRVGRVTAAGRWVWKHELKEAVEDLAIGPDGHCAVSTDSGRLLVYDPAGQSAGTFEAGGESLSLVEAVDGAPAGVAWVTLTRRSQVIRGHDLAGRVHWQAPVAFEGWQFHRLGPVALVTAADGRAQAFDGSGQLVDQGAAAEGAKDLFAVNVAGQVRRVSGQGAHLICSDLAGRVKWRAVCDQPIGPMAAGPAGVAAFVGRSLAWFPGLD